MGGHRTVAWGDFDLAAEQVRKWVLELPDDERFLLYADYELSGSETAEPTTDPEEERLHSLARQHPEGIGHWVIKDQDGNVIDEFRHFED